ncbi:hypothetical protein NKH18_24355 [Streptomyces sp. M10(2022)]
MSTEARPALIDRVIAMPFPVGEEGEDSGARSSGPGHHLLILRATRDFWDDRATELVEPAEQEIDDEFCMVALALTQQWGEPETVDLWPYLEEITEDPEAGGGSARNRWGSCATGGQRAGLAHPRGERWLGPAVGQANPEFPSWLLAAVGEVAALPLG